MSTETLKKFQAMTDKLFVTKRHPIDPIIEHSIDGIGSEAGELVDAGKRIKWYGTEPDYTNLLEECGDILFYMDKLLRKIGSDFDGAMQANMRKLSKRYKDYEFTKDQAVNRDLDTERDVLEGSSMPQPFCVLCLNEHSCETRTNTPTEIFACTNKKVAAIKTCGTCISRHVCHKKKCEVACEEYVPIESSEEENF